MSNLFSGDANYMIERFVNQICPVDRDWFESQVHRFIHKKELDVGKIVGMVDGYKVGIMLHIQTNSDFLHVQVDQGEVDPVGFLLKRNGKTVQLASSIG